MSPEQKAQLKTIEAQLKELHKQAEDDVGKTEEGSDAEATACEIDSYLDDAYGAVREVNEILNR